MYDILSFSFFPVIILWLIIWLDIRKNPRYSKRPLYVLLSGLPLIFMCLLAFYLSNEKGDMDKVQFKAALVLFSTGFYLAMGVLEYSIHIQRIKKGHLWDDFKKKLKTYYIFAGINILSAVYSLLTMLSINPVNINFHYISGINLISLGAVCIYSIISLFSLWILRHITTVESSMPR